MSDEKKCSDSVNVTDALRVGMTIGGICAAPALPALLLFALPYVGITYFAKKFLEESDNSH